MSDTASDVPRPTPHVRMLLGFAAATTAAALVGSAFPPGEWYAALQKPPWTPPPWIFGPVWGLLYAMIAAAGFLAWRSARSRRAATLVLSAWIVQLILNASWSPIFFGLQRPLLALADITILLFAIVACIPIFARSSRTAAILFAPYAAWVAFAAALNASLWQLNR